MDNILKPKDLTFRSFLSFGLSYKLAHKIVQDQNVFLIIKSKQTASIQIIKGLNYIYSSKQ